ncbi:Prostaglandin G/H synthase 1 [Liparis tanakae]|uniref:Prostaglandin G/H synthase 1 n=1 Tax=Liparis tanakae TaxID=230148 RepID=A0A4Z2GS40_9TELE|nr:Prostaglandin G/H synthase 1 [Liparis tanakae]
MDCRRGYRGLYRPQELIDPEISTKESKIPTDTDIDSGVRMDCRKKGLRSRRTADKERHWKWSPLPLVYVKVESGEKGDAADGKRRTVGKDTAKEPAPGFVIDPRIGGGFNINPAVTRVSVVAIKESRTLRMQPFNEYRKRFNLKPYASFREFTDNEEIASELEEFYGDIDSLEFYPGLLLERTRQGSIFGESMVEMGAPFSLKGLLGNPICSPVYWKPSTFGGKVGFDIVNSATLKKLVCQNTRTCPHVAFRVPTEEQSETGSDDESSKTRTEEL